MMNFKTFALGFLCAALIVFTASTGVLAEGEIRVASYFGETHPATIAQQEAFKPHVEENTDFDVGIYHSSMLGDEVEFMESTRAGAIEMCILGNMMEHTIEELLILQQPYLFDDIDHLLTFIGETELGQEMMAKYEDHDLKHLATFSQGEVHLVNNENPIESPEDMEGLDFRVWEGRSPIEGVEALGASASTMPISEAYTAFQQGLLQGVPTTVTNIIEWGWQDVGQYVTLDRFMVFPNYMLANLDWYEGLSEEDQQVLEEAAEKFAERARELVREQRDEYIERLEEEYGTEFIELTDEEREEFREEAWEVMERFKQDYEWAEEYVEKIEEVRD